MKKLIVVAFLTSLSTSAAAQTDSDSTITPPKHVPGTGCTFPSNLADPLHPGEAVTATFCFHIEPEGSVKDLFIIETSGNNLIDRKLASCILQFKYIPAMQNGKPVEIVWTMHFSVCTKRHSCDPPASTMSHDEVESACKNALGAAPATPSDQPSQ